MTSPIARTSPKAKYDQITVLGVARRATTGDEFIKLPLTTFLSAVLPWLNIASVLDVLKYHKGRNGRKTSLCARSLEFRSAEWARSG